MWPELLQEQSRLQLLSQSREGLAAEGTDMDYKDAERTETSLVRED